MNHTYYLVSLDYSCDGQAFWVGEDGRQWTELEAEYATIDDPDRLLLSDEKLGGLAGCPGNIVEVIDSDMACAHCEKNIQPGLSRCGLISALISLGLPRVSIYGERKSLCPSSTPRVESNYDRRSMHPHTLMLDSHYD